MGQLGTKSGFFKMLKSFLDWIFGKKQELAKPVGSQSVQPENSWTEGHAVVSQEKQKSFGEYSRIGISYEDGEGKRSDRIISVAQLRVADSAGEHSTIVAYCHTAKAIRHFRVDRLKGFFDPDTGEVLKNATLKADPSVFRLAPVASNADPAFLSLDDVHSAYAKQLEEMGWIVVREAFELGDRVACYRMAKRGKRRLKYPSVELSYQEFHVERDYSLGVESPLRKGERRKRPWCVSADSAITRTFGSLETAAPAFIDAAKTEAEKQGL